MPTLVGISFGSGLRRDVVCTAFLMGLCSKGLGQLQIFGQCPHCQSMSLLNCKSRDCKWMYLQTHVLKPRLEMYFVVVLVLSHVQLLRPHGLSSEPGSPPWRKTWQPTLVFLPGKSHGQRNLEGYSPWGCKTVGHNLVTEHTHTWCLKNTWLFWWKKKCFFRFILESKVLHFRVKETDTKPNLDF